MNEGVLNVLMKIPAVSPDFSISYSGSLSAMDLTRLNAFLDIAEHIRIKSGMVQELTFKTDVSAGRAIGYVRAIYKDFKIAVLDKKNGMEYGFDNQFATLMANTFKLRNTNYRDAAGARKTGKINYTRKPGDEFTQFAWYALRSGILDLINQ